MARHIGLSCARSSDVVRNRIWRSSLFYFAFWCRCRFSARSPAPTVHLHQLLPFPHGDFMPDRQMPRLVRQRDAQAYHTIQQKVLKLEVGLTKLFLLLVRCNSRLRTSVTGPSQSSDFGRALSSACRQTWRRPDAEQRSMNHTEFAGAPFRLSYAAIAGSCSMA